MWLVASKVAWTVTALNIDSEALTHVAVCLIKYKDATQLWETVY